jgi:hypothetical protein
MIYSEVWSIEGGTNTLVATLAWDGRRWIVDPPAPPGTGWGNELEQWDGGDPRAYLQFLHDSRSTSYVRISAPREGTPPPVTRSGVPARSPGAVSGSTAQDAHGRTLATGTPAGVAPR